MYVYYTQHTCTSCWLTTWRVSKYTIHMVMVSTSTQHTETTLQTSFILPSAVNRTLHFAGSAERSHNQRTPLQKMWATQFLFITNLPAIHSASALSLVWAVSNAPTTRPITKLSLQYRTQLLLTNYATVHVQRYKAIRYKSASGQWSRALFGLLCVKSRFEIEW